MKNVLVLGAGLVAKPLVRYLLDSGYNVKVASRTISKAEFLIENHPNGYAEQLNVEDKSRLKELIGETDIVISLLPYTHHVTVADICIQKKRDMVTTSYVSDKMQGLNTKAVKAGIIILNETGLDPGIDHMSAMKIIHRVKDNGGKITSFCSYCGGLPAPEANTNPFGYKFSWSPKGVVLAAKNNAKYLKNGKEVFVPSEKLFDALSDEVVITPYGKLYRHCSTVFYLGYFVKFRIHWRLVEKNCLQRNKSYKFFKTLV